MASHHATAAEMRNMPLADLLNEVKSKRATIAKMHLGVELSSEKDTALFHREKKELARLLTVLGEKNKLEPAAKPASSKKSALKAKPKASKVPASSK